MNDQKSLEQNEIAIGDQVFLVEKSFTNESRMVLAKIVDARWILGKLSYVIETEGGKRKVVGSSQVSRAADR